MALAILGGTFDPVHNAHLAMARAALVALPVDELHFLPTGTTQYRSPALASAKHRLAMLALALEYDARFKIDERELDPRASGYTVDTLKSLRAELGVHAEIYFLLGADQLEKLDAWHCPDEVRALAKLAVFARPGYEAKEANVKVIPMAPMAVSASDIRERVRRGESIAGLVPGPVANYIERHRLYQ